MEILIQNKIVLKTNRNCLSKQELEDYIYENLGIPSNSYYLICNGKILHEFSSSENGVHIVPRILGGKGGFGSMLRAIGAQIEKTTNREACRDLSGRRLRDINEEQRLKNWINRQAEKEKEAAEKKKKKLEKLCEELKFEFKDEEYEKERSLLPEVVEDAVLKGLEASCSTKRKQDIKAPIKKKKPKLWVDSELDDLSCSGSDSDEENSSETSNTENSSPKQTESSKTDTASETKSVNKDKVENDSKEQTVQNEN